MNFDETLQQVADLLRREGRVSYRALKRRFALDDEYLEDLKAELIHAKRLARDEDGLVLVWTVGSSEGETAKRGNGEGGVASPPPAAPSIQHLPAERRQLTVMFCDLVGSTALSERLDPEELRELVRAYQQMCSTVIARFDGYIAQYLGDGLLVYFGYPQAHEDDAQRAVRTGLEIVEAVGQVVLPGSRLAAPLQVRIGIHTGLVVVGDMGASGKLEYLALGETPNVAARLQGLATPNTVAISAATERLTQGYFVFESLGDHVLKGLSHPLQVYRAVRETGLRSRLQVAQLAGLTPLVGRGREEALLRERWDQAKTSGGQVVLVVGEAGIGKSHLVQALVDRVASEPHARLDFRGSPYYRHSAFYPVVDLLQRACGLKREDTPAVKREKLAAAFAPYPIDREETVPLFAALLAIAPPSPPLALTPQQQKQKTLDAALKVLLAVADRQPLLLVAEDLHWIDPSTVELLGMLIDRLSSARILAVLTFRPEFVPPWLPSAALVTLKVDRLPQPDVEEMVSKVTRGKALPPDVLRQIVTTTDGVPLFVEELTKMVVESGLLQEKDGAYHLVGPLGPLAIPVTLHDSLMARLDRLSTVKEVAQVGAAIGREFSYEVLRTVASVEEATLQRELDRLVEAELLYRSGTPPHATYVFKHALIREAAYQSLLKSTRQQYHLRIAHALLTHFPELREVQPELLAHHYTEAGLLNEAYECWAEAGRQAAKRSANTEAISHLSQALHALEGAENTPDNWQRELNMRLALGASVIMTKGYAAPEVAHTYARAWELCQKIGDSPLLFPALAGLFRFYIAKAELSIAHDLGEQALRLVAKGDEPILRMAAHVMLGSVAVLRGEFSTALGHLAPVDESYDFRDHRSVVLMYGDDPGLIGLTQLGLTRWYLGYPEQAMQAMRRALTLSEQSNIPYILANTYGFTSQLSFYLRDWGMALRMAEELLALADEHGFEFWKCEGPLLRGSALTELGREEEGIQLLHEKLSQTDVATSEMGRPRFLSVLAAAYGKRGQPEAGLALMDEALATVQQSDVYMHEAELWRMKGELLLQLRAG